MNAIERTFADLKKQRGRAFIPYVTAGDPTIEKTAEVLDYFAKKGADIIELGVPFSDPMADGPVIQRAMERALRAGASLKKTLAVVREFRKRHGTPLILMGYFNPFFAYGLEKFARDAGKAGVDGILTVDLPPEEASEFTELLADNGVTSVFLATPVTDERRIAVIRKIARGFIYFVSVTGVTGERRAFSGSIDAKIKNLKKKTGLPVVLGFGISGPEMIERHRKSADGFVVGSAVVNRLEQGFASRACWKEFEVFFKSLTDACHRPD